MNGSLHLGECVCVSSVCVYLRVRVFIVRVCARVKERAIESAYLCVGGRMRAFVCVCVCLSRTRVCAVGVHLRGGWVRELECFCVCVCVYVRGRVCVSVSVHNRV